MRISVEERLVQVKRKDEQLRQQKILDENRAKETRKKLDSRCLFIVGELFCKHFPIAQEITPGKSAEEDRLNFEHLDQFMEALAKCQQCYQELEDALIENDNNNTQQRY